MDSSIGGEKPSDLACRLIVYMAYEENEYFNVTPPHLSVPPVCFTVIKPIKYPMHAIFLFS